MLMLCVSSLHVFAWSKCKTNGVGRYVSIQTDKRRRDMSCCDSVVWKNNKFGKIEYGAALRHVDVKQCTVSMFGFYLFARFMIDNEAFPVFPKNEDWFTTKILKSSKGGMKQALSYNAYNTQVTD